METSVFATIGKLSFFILSLLFLGGCANRDVAQKVYLSGDYAKAVSIWKRWSDAGYGSASFRLAKMAKNGKYKISNDDLIRLAKKAYFAKQRRAAFILEDTYLQNGEYQKSLFWFERGDINSSSPRDLDNHLFLISHIIEKSKLQQKYLQKIETLAKNQNRFASYKLGKFYENSDTEFYNLKKSVEFYRYAYKQGDNRAGIRLAVLYIYQLKREKEGIELLQKIASQGDAVASLLIGDYLNQNITTFLKKENQNCIACSFSTPLEYYVKKLTLEKLRDMYIEKNVVPWYKNAYRQGSIKGVLGLIELDIKYDNFKEDKPAVYSNMSLNEAIIYLNGVADKFFKAKMILAQIYMKYPALNKTALAEQIYHEYMKQNRIDAQWHLYQYFKKIAPNSTQKQSYLNALLKVGFKPAKIEKSYENILNNIAKKEDFAFLRSEAKRGSIKALTYLSSLISKGLVPDETAKEANEIQKKICILEPFNVTNDLKIADGYLKNKEITKAATIYQFYAQQNNPKAQYSLSNIYKILCKTKLKLYWLKSAKALGYKKAILLYSKLVLRGDVKGDVKKSLQIVEDSARNGDVKAIELLAYLYANGIVVDFEPKRALFYYDKLMRYDKRAALSGKIKLFKSINVNHKYDKKIVLLYEELLKLGGNSVKIELAQFFILNHKSKRAKELLLSLPLSRYSQARYLLWYITGDMGYLPQKPSQIKNGKILLVYAKKYLKSKSQKALLYAFRATLCNTPNSGKIIYELMSLIDDSHTIKRIFALAKSYPKCSNFKSKE
jgi:hypothetical protein